MSKIKTGDIVDAGDAIIYADSYGGGGDKQYFSYDPVYKVLKTLRNYVLVPHHSLSDGYTGWFKQKDVSVVDKGLEKE